MVLGLYTGCNFCRTSVRYECAGASEPTKDLHNVNLPVGGGVFRVFGGIFCVLVLGVFWRGFCVLVLEVFWQDFL